MSEQNNDFFDFDYWMNLAKENPSAFDEHRKNEIKAVIESAPEHMHKRLFGLQWRIDMDIKKGKNPMDSCLRVYRMMLDSIYGENGLLEALTRASENTTSPVAQKRFSGDVVDFKAHKIKPNDNGKSESVLK
ncbi:MAG: DUF3135 domain-containing protein [Methylococcales bacterium]